jgi:Zn finger protein HypA/HybF involved in hydrogenase expression
MNCFIYNVHSNQGKYMGIIDNAKEIASLVKKLGDIDLYRKIVDLEGEIIELTKEKRQLDEKLADITRSKVIIDELRFNAPFYTNADNTELYCARCIEVDRRAIHVVKQGELEMRRRVYLCPQCESKFADVRTG